VRLGKAFVAFLDYIDPGNSGGSVPTRESPFLGIGVSVITYSCSICGGLFDSRDDLFEHRFQNHPFKRPSLLLGGKEITSPRQLVARQLNPIEIEFANVKRFFVDGAPVQRGELVDTLADRKYGLCNIILENDGVKSTYQLDFDVPDSADMERVEQVFFEVFGSGILDLTHIDLFIDMTEKLKTTTRYVDGLSHYLYGILAKDQRGGTFLKQSEYNAKFNQSIDVLKHFDRSLALAIIGVVNFNQNVFDSIDKLTLAPKACSAMLKFFNYVTGEISLNKKLIINKTDNIRKIPLDYSTEKIYEWSSMAIEELKKNRKELEQALKSQDWMPNDKFKVKMLLAELFLEIDDLPAAIRLAGSFSNDTVFGPWAQRILEKKI
jgi:hypothetical protein